MCPFGFTKAAFAFVTSCVFVFFFFFGFHAVWRKAATVQ